MWEKLIREDGAVSRYWGNYYMHRSEGHFEFGHRDVLWWFWYSQRVHGGKMGLHLKRWSIKFGRVKDEMFSERNNIDVRPIRFLGFSLVIWKREE